MTRKQLGVAVVIATCAWSTAGSQQTPVPHLQERPRAPDGRGVRARRLRPSRHWPAAVRLHRLDRRRTSPRPQRADVRQRRGPGGEDRDPGAAVYTRLGRRARPGRHVFAVDRDSIRSGSERAILTTASAMIPSFSPADAVGVIGLPVGGIDPTRDHAAAAEAIRMMTGTRPVVNWRFRLTWREAIESGKR